MGFYLKINFKMNIFLKWKLLFVTLAKLFNLWCQTNEYANREKAGRSMNGYKSPITARHIVDAFDDLAGGTQGFTIYDPSLGSERFTDGAAGGAIIGASLNAEYKHHTPVPGVTYGNFTPANTGTGLAASVTEDTTRMFESPSNANKVIESFLSDKEIISLAIEIQNV